MTAAHIRPDGDTFAIVHADGTIETFAAFIERIKKDIHSTLHVDLRIIKSSNGNYQLSFDRSLYPGVDRNLAKEENDRIRSTAVGKRFVLLGAITNELAKLGLPFGAVLSPRDTRQVTDQATGQTRWSATTQMWLNMPGGTTASAPVAKTDESLMAEALVANEEKANGYLENDNAFKDGKLTSLVRARLTALIAAKTAQATQDTPAAAAKPETPAKDADDMPTD